MKDKFENIDDVVERLQELKEKHGNIKVKIFDYDTEQDINIDLIGVPTNTEEKFVRIVREE